MARKPIPELTDLLSVYDSLIVKTALQLRAFVLDLFPEANELIYDSYNALAIAYSLSDKQKDAFCHIPIYSKHVNLGFNKGAELSDSETLLQGNGKSIRHFTVKSFDEFPAPYMKKLLLEAHSLAKQIMKENTKPVIGLSTVKSSSPNKKRPTALSKG